VAAAIDALALTRGARVLHVGAGLGYYSALMAHVVGDSGRVLAIEVDDGLAADAGANLSSMPWVDVRCADSTVLPGELFDAILVSAGATHPQQAWLDALVQRLRRDPHDPGPECWLHGPAFCLSIN